MTERFTKQQFEDALPRDKENGTPWWSEIASSYPEYTYIVPVSDEVEIMILSSIRLGELYCGGTGENSIRVWLVDAIERKPLGVKLQRWIARTAKWRENLLALLRELYKIGTLLGTCPVCKVNQRRLLKTKKAGPNQDRLFISCECRRYFKWLDEEIS